MWFTSTNDHLFSWLCRGTMLWNIKLYKDRDWVIISFKYFSQSENLLVAQWISGYLNLILSGHFQDQTLNQFFIAITFWSIKLGSNTRLLQFKKIFYIIILLVSNCVSLHKMSINWIIDHISHGTMITQN